MAPSVFGGEASVAGSACLTVWCSYLVDECHCSTSKTSPQLLQNYDSSCSKMRTHLLSPFLCLPCILPLLEVSCMRCRNHPRRMQSIQAKVHRKLLQAVVFVDVGSVSDVGVRLVAGR